MKALTSKELRKLTPFELKRYSELGILRVMKTQPIPARIEDTPEFKKHKHLAGKPIHYSAACKKYAIAISTLSQWVARGLIKKLEKQPEHGNKIMLDEAYVAYATTVRNEHKNSKGKWLFAPNGTPYTPTTHRKR